ncbi:MAG TPA: molybdopterin-dependent oxidoreductase [Ktedonobacterales bacterium]|nr:molybdopterin-dependent oxidoreductase [Ktedonobacterales bacterium]
MDAEKERARGSGRWRPMSFPRAWRFGSGAWAIMLAQAVGFALAALAQVPPPLEPLTEAIMQATPVTLANTLLDALGPLARPLALIGAAALCLPVAGLVALASPAAAAPTAGQPARWWARWALVAALALALMTPLALLAAYPQEALAAWLVGALFAPALWLARPWYARLTQPHADEVASDGAPITRRAALRRLTDSGVMLASFALLGSFTSWASLIGGALGSPERLRHLFRYAPPAPRAAGFPVAGVEPEVTPAASFYLVSKNAVDPVLAPEDWLLRVTGLVETPLTLTYEQVMLLPRVDEYVTLRCVDSLPGSHLMSNAYWSGVSLGALLRRAGVRASAGTALIHAPDGYAETLPLAAALDPTTLLAYGMNGETLPRRHGGPVRLLAPGYVGFKNVKWVAEIELAAATTQGYWAERGWTAAQVHSVARIDVWRADPGGVLLAGVAYAGAAGVGAVELRVDDGSWGESGQAALNAPTLAPTAWAQWRATLPLTPGAHTIAARVIDAEGRIQPPGDARIFPDGATGYHSVEVRI